jgi:3',5'-cyclic AMP phosphodiesterase CpdA
MRIAQISDTHISVPPVRTADREADLAAVIDALTRLDPLPDVVIHTGDAANLGRPEEYERLAALMSRLPMPWLITPGNRDCRRYMREGLREATPLPSGLGPVDFAVNIGGIRFLGFDSKGPGTNKGWADAGRRAALRALLEEAPDTPTVVFMHHPPFAIENARDPYQFAEWEQAEALSALIAAQAQVRLVLTGHTHRFASARLVDVPAFTMPSVATDLRKGTGERQVGRLPAWMVYDLGANGTLLKHELMTRRTPAVIRS